ncbi:MAG: DUF4412 domain-containing protein [Acidobacteriota bacterium]
MLVRPVRFLTLLLLLICLLAPAAFAGDALYYEARTTVEKGPGNSTVNAWIDGERAHIAFRDSDNPMIAPGTYMVTEDGGKTLYLIDDEKKTYTPFDLEAMLQFAGNALNAIPLTKIEITDPTVETELDEAGESMLGRDTRHVRLRTSYTMKMRIMGIRKRQMTETVQDVWLVDGFDDAALGVWLRTEPKPTGNDELDKLVKTTAAPFDGFPVKIVAETTTRNKKGRGDTVRTITEVTTLERRSADGVNFTVPRDTHTEQQMMMPGANDNEEGGGNPLRGLFGGGRDGR